jgi:hypothetical protein
MGRERRELSHLGDPGFGRDALKREMARLKGCQTPAMLPSYLRLVVAIT